MDFWALQVPCGERINVKVVEGEEVYLTQAAIENIIDCEDEMVVLLVHQENLNDCVVGAFLRNIPQQVYNPEILLCGDFQISHTGSNCIVAVCGYRVAPSQNPSYRATGPVVGITSHYNYKDWGLTEEDGIYKIESKHDIYPVPCCHKATFEVKEGEEVHITEACMDHNINCNDEMVALLIHQENTNDRVVGAFLRDIPRQAYNPPFVFYEDFQVSHTGSVCGVVALKVGRQLRKMSAQGICRGTKWEYGACDS